jgi:hypothetical protein
LDRNELKKMLGMRVADGSLMRLIGKGVHVGVLDSEVVQEPELGTAQGSVLSPLLGNVYLHDGLDRWCETEVKPRLQGKASLRRAKKSIYDWCRRHQVRRDVLCAFREGLSRDKQLQKVSPVVGTTAD